LLIAALSIAGIGVTPRTASAQGATATLTGVIVDETNAVVPDVQVALLNVATQQHRETATDRQGAFVIPVLPPGRYRLTATRDGFTPLEVPDITLNVNDQVALRLQMKVAAIGETVAIVVEPSRVNLSPAVSTVIDRKFVETLPMNGRSFQTLLTLVPGVVLSGAAGQQQGQISVNGQRDNANAFMVDGVSANVSANAVNNGIGQHVAGSTPGQTISGGYNGLLSVDALEEFRIQTSTYGAEFGRQPGGQISLNTRSGTNAFHGSLFEYLRNEALNANDWFANRDGSRKPPMRQNQFGGTLGGPVVRNRLFFFGNYEGMRLRVPTTVSGSAVPATWLRETAPASLRAFLDAFPLPTGPALTDPQTGRLNGTAGYTAAYSTPSNLDTTAARVDWRPDAVQVFARVSHSPSSMTTRPSGMSNMIDERRGFDSTTIGSTQQLGHAALNEARLNITRSTAPRKYLMDDFGGAVPAAIAQVLPGFTPAQGGNNVVLFRPSVAVTTLGTGLVSWQTMEGRGGMRNQQINVTDTLTWVRSRHEWKFGLDFRRLAPSYQPSPLSVSVLFNSAAAILAGVADQVSVQAEEPAEPRIDNLSLFAQDTWRLSGRATLTYGVRWELNPLPGEANGLTPPVVIGIDTSEGPHLAPEGTPLYETSYRNFAPRLGVSYRLSDAPGRESVLRGGAGLYYDLGNTSAADAFGFGFPYVRARTRLSVPWPVDPALLVAPPVSATLPMSTGWIYGYEPGFTTPRTWQTSVTLEQALGRAQTISVSVIGAFGRDLIFQQTRQFLPNFTTIRWVTNDATSSYRAVQVQFQRRLSAGLQSTVSYAWSRARDIASEDISSPGAAEGPADFDVPHRFSAAISYALPAPSLGRIGTAILKDWSIATLVQTQSGYPFTVIAGSVLEPVTNRSMSVRPNAVPGVAQWIDDPSAPGGRRVNMAAFVAPAAGQQGNVGRNSLRGFPIRQVDFTINRQFTLRGAVRLQAQVEAYNIFNWPNFGLPNAQLTASPSIAGRPSAMFGTAIGGLTSLYQTGGPRAVQLAAKILF
jgi:hypothetical protein